jgi:hypothetical protein
MLHMFDGYAMVNKLRIQDGKVFFSHRCAGGQPLPGRCRATL